MMTLVSNRTIPRGKESPEYAVVAPWFFAAVEDWVERRHGGDEPLFAALITGNLRGIVEQADSSSQRTVWLMLKYLYNHVPSDCWGSLEAARAWSEAQFAPEGGCVVRCPACNRAGPCHLEAGEPIGFCAQCALGEGRKVRLVHMEVEPS